jgi:predicted ATP-grasp superfamily ATP-dependent carboligase
VKRLAARIAAAPADRRRAVACVIGDVDLVRTLGLARLRSALVAPPGSAGRYSRFTGVALEWLDPRDRPDALAQSLLAYGSAQPEPPVLYYQGAAALLFVSRHRDRLRQAFRFTVPEASLAEQLTDGDRFRQLAARLRLPVAHGSPHPVPAASRETYHSYVDQQGRTVAEFTGRADPLEITQAPDVAALGRDLVRRLKLRGVATLDFVRGPDGSLRLLEVSPWFSRWHHAGARAGINIPVLVYRDLISQPRAASAAARTGSRWSRRLSELDPWPLVRTGIQRLLEPASVGKGGVA